MKAVVNQKRIAALDGLRGIAILMVAMAHFLPENVFFGKAAKFITTFGGGGVILFFLLSGYLIDMNLTKQPIHVFIIRRLFKLFPAYQINIIVVIFLSWIGSNELPSTQVFFANLFLVQDFLRVEMLNNVYWTLLIEFKFYLLMAICKRYVPDRYIMVIPIMILALNWGHLYILGRASVLLTYMPVFFVGVAIYRCQRMTFFLSFAWTGLVSVFVALSLFYFLEINSESSAIFVLVSAVFFLIALQIHLEVSFLSFFGKISYSMYLYHTAIGYPLLAYLVLRFEGIARLNFILAVFILITLWAYFSFHLIEISGSKLGRYIEKRWVKRII